MNGKCIDVSDQTVEVDSDPEEEWTAEDERAAVLEIFNGDLEAYENWVDRD